MILLLFGLGSVLPLAAQTDYRFKDPLADHFILPYEVSQNLIIIPCRVNNSTTLKLVLDCGISNTIITGLVEEDTIPMFAARKITVGGLGSGAPVEAFYSRNNQVEISHPDNPDLGMTGSNMDIYLLTTDQFELSRQLGMRVNGLIGSDLFEDFIVGLDPVSKQISFHDRSAFNFKRLTRSYEKIPLTIIDHKAYVDVNILQENDSSVTVRLLIDSGASLSMWIAPVADSAIIIPRATVRSLLGQGLSGIISGVNGRIVKARLGSFVFKRPLVSYPDSASVSGLNLSSQRHGSLGNEILRRFSVYFDFEGSALYLKPNKWFRAPFSYNRSGMDIEKVNPLIPVYTIFSIIPGSPADMAGLLPDDVIEYINYLPAFNMRLDDINSILYGESGEQVLLRIDRNGEKMKVRFRLQRKI